MTNRPILLFACPTTLALATLALAAVASAQASQPVAPAASRPQFFAPPFPLQPDAAWFYRVTLTPAAAAPATAEMRVVGLVPVDGGHAFELRTRISKYRSYEYWSLRKDGIYLHRNAMLGGMRGVNRRTKPRLMLPLPLGVTDQWEWDEEGSVQTMAGSVPPSADDLRMHYTARIEQIQERVTVPAGTFAAARVSIRCKSKMFGESREVWWFAPGTGPVKRVQSGPNGSNARTIELTSFEPGVKGRPAPIVTARAFLAGDPFGQGQPDEVAPVNERAIAEGLRSQFFLARWQTSVGFIRVFAGKATKFHPLSKKHWQELITSEGHAIGGGPAAPGDGQQSAEAMAKAFGILMLRNYHNGIQGLILAQTPKSTYSFKSGELTIEGICYYRQGGAQKQSHTKMVFRDNTLIDLWSDATVETAATGQADTNPPDQRENPKRK